jgi:hypothetical protein
VTGRYSNQLSYHRAFATTKTGFVEAWGVNRGVQMPRQGRKLAALCKIFASLHRSGQRVTGVVADSLILLGYSRNVSAIKTISRGDPAGFTGPT